VDPLDGTSNYLSGIDVWAVSIALLKGEKIILGIVHKPSTKENFFSLRGDGAYHDGKKMESAKPFRLKDSLVGTGLPYRSPDTTESFFKSAEEILFKSRDIRRIGSAALDLAYVAAGYLQAFWEIDLQSYDLAAALLFLEETGCPYSTIRGNPYDPFRSRSFVTGRPGAMEELRGVLARHYSVD
jgi:myo-inositol-1(or 4)-monophosphatase